MSIWKALQAGKMSVFITLALYHGLDKDTFRYGWKTQFCLLPLTIQLQLNKYETAPKFIQ